IKGMNHAVTAGALAAEAFTEARSRGDTDRAGAIYEQKVDEHLMDKLRPRRYEVAKRVGENEAVTSLTDKVLKSSVGRFGVRLLGGTIENMYSSPFLAMMAPDTRTPYVTLPSVIAEELGRPVDGTRNVDLPSLADRIGDLTYDTDVGNPHIEVLDNSMEASGAAVTACPVSAQDFGGGCYRAETVKRDGHEEEVVSLDTQPCVECGTCAIIADTEWEHPRGGKGVEFRQG
ncbi:MAG: flavoprotein, partial [Halorientalis sp.]